MPSHNETHYNAAAWYYCPKCNSKDNSVRYEVREELKKDITKTILNQLEIEVVEEWIKITCNHCGYEWKLKTFDKRPDNG